MLGIRQSNNICKELESNQINLEIRNSEVHKYF
jgi:hypothetical protein